MTDLITVVDLLVATGIKDSVLKDRKQYMENQVNMSESYEIGTYYGCPIKIVVDYNFMDIERENG